MMKKYVIVIEEVVVQNFEIEADSQEEALNKLETGYKNGIYVLEPGEVQSKKMSIVKPEQNATEWIEF
jgi:formylmethanofuran dehydrogenase subunit A|nr:DpnD/PcfM family protein [Ruminococcus bromii]